MNDNNFPNGPLTDKELHGYTMMKATKVGGVIGEINTPFSGMSDINNVIKLFLKYGKIIKNGFSAISWLNLIFGIFGHLLSVTSAIFFSKKHPATRAMKALTGIALLTLGILSTAAGLSSFSLVLASCCVDATQKLWLFIDMIRRYYVGDWHRSEIKYQNNKKQFYKLLQDPAQLAQLKEYREHANEDNKHLFTGQIVELDQKLTEEKNKLISKKVRMANQTHALAISAMTVIGASLLFTPAFLVGGAIIIAMAIYAVADKFNLNPFRWLVNKAFGDHYKQRAHHSTMLKIEKKLQPKTVLNADDQLVKQNITGSTNHLFKKLNGSNYQVNLNKQIKVSSSNINIAKSPDNKREPCNDPDFSETEEVKTVTATMPP